MKASRMSSVVLAYAISLLAPSVMQAANPDFTKSFGKASIPLNQTTTLTFTITNNDSTFPLTNIMFTDTLPLGLQASPVLASNGCSFTPVVTPATPAVNPVNPATVTVSSGVNGVGPGTFCTFSVTV